MHHNILILIFPLHYFKILILSTIIIQKILKSHVDPPQVMVEATKQVLTSADSTEPLPKLTCSVMEDDRLPVKQLRWTKDGQVLAEVQDSGILAFDTATNPIEVSSLGLYTCEAMLASQIEAENSILIAERGMLL